MSVNGDDRDGARHEGRSRRATRSSRRPAHSGRHQRHRYILLNKPRGYVTTRSDPQGRPTVMDLLKGVSEYVYPVGRLDYDSEGLLLLTNDGELAARLMHPRHEVDEVYEARVRGVPDAQRARAARARHHARRTRTAPAQRAAAPEPRSSATSGRADDDRDRDARRTAAAGAADVRSRRPSGRAA